LSEHLVNVQVEKLPRTFQDAITFTRRLGLRYLWIDSLCIIQDDSDDWAREASGMMEVYINCYVCIAANQAKGQGDGFLLRESPLYTSMTLMERREDVERRVQLYIHPLLPELHLLWTLDRRELRGAHLQSRAWALQERILAPRVLHFTEEQIHFECNTHFISEDGYQMHHRIKHRYLSPGYSHIVGRQPWYRIVTNYSSRSLTKPSDRLPAMSGIAKHFSAQGKSDKYRAGL
jgi:hypothetical protein